MPNRSILNPDEDQRSSQDGFDPFIIRNAVNRPLPYVNEEITRRVSLSTDYLVMR